MGIKELKNRLSHYIRLVKRGEAVQVTDRGTVVAELRPPGEGPIDRANPAIEALIRRGGVTIGRPNRADLYDREGVAVNFEADVVQKLLDAEREDR